MGSVQSILRYIQNDTESQQENLEPITTKSYKHKASHQSVVELLDQHLSDAELQPVTKLESYLGYYKAKAPYYYKKMILLTGGVLNISDEHQVLQCILAVFGCMQTSDPSNMDAILETTAKQLAMSEAQQTRLKALATECAYKFTKDEKYNLKILDRNDYSAMSSTLGWLLWAHNHINGENKVNPFSGQNFIDNGAGRLAGKLSYQKDDFLQEVDTLRTTQGLEQYQNSLWATHIFNPFVHATGSATLGLIAQTGFTLRSALQMLRDFKTGPMVGEISGGGFFSVSGTVDQTIAGKTSLGRVVHMQYDFEWVRDIYTQYPVANSARVEVLNAQEIIESIRKGSIARVDMLWIYLARARQLGRPLSSIISKADQALVLEQLRITENHQSAKGPSEAFFERADLLEEFFNTPDSEFRLTPEAEYFVHEKQFPIIFLMEGAEKTIMDDEAFRAWEPLKLGEDIKMIATDNEAHRELVLDFLQQHLKDEPALAKVSVVLFSEVEYARDHDCKPKGKKPRDLDIQNHYSFHRNPIRKGFDDLVNAYTPIYAMPEFGS